MTASDCSEDIPSERGGGRYQVGRWTPGCQAWRSDGFSALKGGAGVVPGGGAAFVVSVGPGQNPTPGSRKRRSSRSMPTLKPSRLSSRPSEAANVAPTSPSTENCHPVPLGAEATNVLGPR